VAVAVETTHLRAVQVVVLLLQVVFHIQVRLVVALL
jgi:hypothetical protein